MTSLERVVMALEGKEADRVPATPLICYAAHRVYGVRCDEMAMDGEIAGKCWVAARELTGLDAHVLLLDLTLEAHDFGAETEFLLNDVTRPNYNNPMVPDADSYGNVKPIEACVTKGPTGGFSRMAEYIKTLDVIMNENGKDTGVVAFVFGTLGLLGMLRGAEKLFFDCVRNYEPVMAAQNVICDSLLPYIDAIGKTGVHGICLDTLYASGGIMSKKLWNKVEKETSGRLADQIRKNNTGVWVHNCGNAVYMDAQYEAMDCIGLSYRMTARAMRKRKRSMEVNSRCSAISTRPKEYSWAPSKSSWMRLRSKLISSQPAVITSCLPDVSSRPTAISTGP